MSDDLTRVMLEKADECDDAEVRELLRWGVKRIEELEMEAEDLEWANKGIAEWRDIAIRAIDKLKDARVLLREASSALAYHQEQTRPIHRTQETLARIKAALGDRHE